MADYPIGLAVRKAREHIGMSKNDLARLSGLNRQHIYKVENGVSCPKIQTLEAIAAGLDIELWRIFRYASKLRNKPEAA